jgi:hypothetical protein
VRHDQAAQTSEFIGFFDEERRPARTLHHGRRFAVLA